MSRLRLVPLTQRDAADAVKRWHRHNAPTVGDVIRVGVVDDDINQLVAVGTAGRPVARHLDDGYTLEITRVSCDGTPHATSKVYGALTRAALALGYQRVITYTQADESGSSLRAAGFQLLAHRPARKGWSAPSRPRDDALYRVTERQLWEVTA